LFYFRRPCEKSRNDVDVGARGPVCCTHTRWRADGTKARNADAGYVDDELPDESSGNYGRCRQYGTGISVSVTTKPENVAELRKRVEQMAAMHSGQASSPAMMQGQMMPGTVKYEAIDNGAKLTLTPNDPSKLAEFRTQVRAHVEKMQKGECSMMQDMMQGMMGGMGKPETKPEPKKDEVDHTEHHPAGPTK